jgi:hypothetical protein
MLVIIKLNSLNRLEFYYFCQLPIKKLFIALEIEIRTLPVAGVLAGIFAKQIFVPGMSITSSGCSLGSPAGLLVPSVNVHAHDQEPQH